MAGVSYVPLQTLPKATIRNTALHGLWDYDIENCHFAIFGLSPSLPRLCRPGWFLLWAASL